MVVVVVVAAALVTPAGGLLALFLHNHVQGKNRGTAVQWTLRLAIGSGSRGQAKMLLEVKRQNGGLYYLGD